MFEQFDGLLAATMTPAQLKACMADEDQLSSERAPEQRRALNMAKRRLRFEVGKRLRVR